MKSATNMGTTTHFQALIDLNAWQVFGFEGLARFEDGRGPLEHIAEARNNGCINEFELCLIETAITHTSNIPVDLIVTLNVSADTISSPRLDMLKDNFQGRVWGLEILETAPRAQCPADIRTRAAALGCTLLIDDAGTGHSDELQIRGLRPDIVKVDRELFVRSAYDQTACQKMYSLMSAGRVVGAKLLVEGIETQDQVARAMDIGFDYAQGYYFGAAVAQDNVTAHLAGLQQRLGITVGNYCQ